MKFFRRLFLKLRLYFIELGHSISHPKESKRYDFKGMQHRHTCANCSFEYKGKFCPRCGQPASTSKLTPGNIASSILEVGDYNNRSVIGTVIQLFYRPGYFMRDFLKGHRAPYYAPIKLLFFLCVVIAIEVETGIVKKPDTAKIEQEQQIVRDSLAWAWTEDDEDEDELDSIAFSSVSEETGNQTGSFEDIVDEENEELSEEEMKEYLNLKNKKERVQGILGTLVLNFNKYRDWEENHKALYTILLNFSLAFVCWFMFKRAPGLGRLSYTEHFFVQIYISCQLLVLAILILPFWQTSSGDLPFWVLPVVMIWDFRQLFGISWGKSFYKSCLALVLNGIICFVAFMIVMAAIVLATIGTLSS